VKERDEVTATQAPSHEAQYRWFDLEGAAEAYPGVLTVRLLRALISRREIAFSRSGRKIALWQPDIEAYLSGRRQPANHSR
jgi:hypothetical protein